MRKNGMWFPVLAGWLLIAAGCATSQDMATWKEHRTHFASGDHLFFSVKNTEDSAPRVTRRDMTFASAEAWWGKPVTVGPEAILER
jgi:hypothetical protein